MGNIGSGWMLANWIPRIMSISPPRHKGTWIPWSALSFLVLSWWDPLASGRLDAHSLRAFTVIPVATSIGIGPSFSFQELSSIWGTPSLNMAQLQPESMKAWMPFLTVSDLAFQNYEKASVGAHCAHRQNIGIFGTLKAEIGEALDRIWFYRPHQSLKRKIRVLDPKVQIFCRTENMQKFSKNWHPKFGGHIVPPARPDALRQFTFGRNYP